MADKSSELVLEALRRAVAEPIGLPLFAGTRRPGLFSASASAKQAASLCKEQGLLKALRTEAKGKTHIEFCAITEKGLAHLLAEANPKGVLESLVRALDERAAQLNDVLLSARDAQASLETIKATAAHVLEHLHKPAPVLPRSYDKTTASVNGADAWLTGVLDYLANWHKGHALEDCPLPVLYRQARESAPALSIGQFHDGMRKLHERQRIYLHPWTGPLYEIPEPALTLMVGHEIIYYASIRP